MISISSTLQYKIWVAPGQACILQSSVSVALPSQDAPPLAGAGLEQDLDFVFVPPPQGAEHSPVVHSVHPPFTVKIR